MRTRTALIIGAVGGGILATAVIIVLVRRSKANLGRDYLPGGKADKRKPSDFNPRELKKGTNVELEHTSDRRIAREIAMDHLAEDPLYYRKLAAIHVD